MIALVPALAGALIVAGLIGVVIGLRPAPVPARPARSRRVRRLANLDRTTRRLVFGGLALSWNTLPLAMLKRPDVKRRVDERGGEREVQFLFRDHTPVLPVWHEGRLRLTTWGNRRRSGSRNLPCTDWTWLATVEDGGWLHAGA